MLSVSFRRLYFISDKVIARSIRSRRNVPEANPGLQNRINAFKKERLKIEDEDAEEFVEQSDSDFYKVGEAYNTHLNETIAGKQNLKHNIIKEKYFKENMPNLLTWSEKEQIRHLAITQPDEWTPEKIAESFPVTVSVVKKLLKYTWKPTTEDRIARHDASAMRNWRELKEGVLDIPEDIRQHFLKFSERTIPPLRQKPIKMDIAQDKKIGEFEEIVRKCATNDEKKHNDENTEDSETGLVKYEQTVPPVKTGKKSLTLEELTDKIKSRLEEGNKINMNDSMMLDTVHSKTNVSKCEVSDAELSNEVALTGEDSKSSALTTSKKEDTQITYNYMQRIRIPKKAYKRGATYKINDCYYDDDGKFLYRVLGMTN